ncbi:MAG: SDR family oxidoreductase [Corynebacterium sp.]|nr:SDR family oxidoreductase [Corynebacterium sp.]
MENKKVLLVGGHGKIALLAIPKLVAAGHEVTAVIRNPDQSAELTALGAHPLVEDVSEISVQRWTELATTHDVVVWSAGNGGKAGPDVTYAVDQDAAVASMQGAVAAGEQAPRYIMVSWIGTFTFEAPPAGEREGFQHYAAAKREADTYLEGTDLNYVILGPSTLTDQPAGGIELLAADAATYSNPATTSRELVADVITEYVGLPQLPNKFAPFTDGQDAITVLPK